MLGSHSHLAKSVWVIDLKVRFEVKSAGYFTIMSACFPCSLKLYNVSNDWRRCGAIKFIKNIGKASQSTKYGCTS
jgi:hypothetical protein